MADEHLLLGPVSVDRYVQQGLDLPGGGALNMAYHWAGAAVPFRFLTRIGDDRPELFLGFLERHGIAHVPASIVAPGASASIDIVLNDDRQPWMDHFVEGAWTGLRLTDAEETIVRDGRRLHVVLVQPVVEEIARLAADGVLDGLVVSGDFLSFRRYTIDRFAATMAHLDIGFIGWPGDPDDPLLEGVRDVAFSLRKLVLVTMGAKSIRVFDGRSDPAEVRTFAVDAVEVLGTTVGCGDAFVAGFLASFWRDGDLDVAIDRGREMGARATAWLRPLPDAAYAPGEPVQR